MYHHLPMMIQGRNHTIITIFRASLSLSVTLGLIFAIWVSVYVSLLCKGLYGLSLKSDEASETCVLLLQDAVHGFVLVPGTGPDSLVLPSSQDSKGAGCSFLVI